MNIDWTFLAIDLAITIFVFLVFPTIYRITNGKVSMRKAKKIALWNSLICASLFLGVSFFITTGATAAVNFAPAVVYYYIAKAIMGDNNIVGDDIENVVVEDEKETYTICPNCGLQLFEEDLVCPICKTEIKKENQYDTNNTQFEGLDDNKLSPFVNNEKILKDILKTSRIQDFRKKVKIFQISSVVLSILLILFVIIFPTVTITSYNQELAQLKITATKLSNLPAQETTYCFSKENYNFVYQLNNGKIQVYRFFNENRYSSSNSEISGRATTIQIKNYFSYNLKTGKPPIHFVYTYVLPVGIIIPIVLTLSLIILLLLIHQNSKETLKFLTKKIDFLSSIKKDYDEDEISKKEYKSKIKQYLSQKVINNNKFFSIFKILY